MPMEFFSIAKSDISCDTIVQWFQDALIDAEIETDDEENWSQLALYTEDGEAVLEVDRLNRGEPTFSDHLGDIVRRLLDEKEPVKPHSSVKWLCNYLSKVETVYVLRPQAALYNEQGWEIFNEFWTNLKDSRGIVHCDGEGFTNEEGAQITWEFPGGASGDWKMALYDGDRNTWVEFTIDLANQEQRLLFLDGTLPIAQSAGLKTQSE